MDPLLGANGDVLDAVVIVPGILGTELLDAHNTPVWGINRRALTGALLGGSVYDRLRDDRLRPGGLVKLPVFLPGLGRFEPYEPLVTSVRDAVTHPDAVLSFGYDWRKPLAETAAELAIAAAQHLDTWRHHPRGSRDARLVFVAHSMGGLLARHATQLHRDQLPVDDVRLVLTLGTPHSGSVKAVRALCDGEVLPLGWLLPQRAKRRLRDLARVTASVHDLLPAYACIDDRAPTVSDFHAIGADPSLLATALVTRKRFTDTLSEHGAQRTVCEAIVGTAHPTLQRFSVTDGEVQFHEDVADRNWFGDGTVYFGSAYPPDTPWFALPQSHGALGQSREVRAHVIAKLSGLTLGPPQGGEYGALIPEAVTTGKNFTVEVTGTLQIGCTWTDPTTGRGGTLALLPATRDDGTPCRRATHAFERDGLYTITVDGGGISPTSYDVLAEPSDP